MLFIDHSPSVMDQHHTGLMSESPPTITLPIARAGLPHPTCHTGLILLV